MWGDDVPGRTTREGQLRQLERRLGGSLQVIAARG
jgi:hypothetical protein